jgi:hypothetical protein
MRLFESIDRVIRIHSLIQREATGSPDVFASRLNLRRRQLYNILSEFRDSGAEIKYSHFKMSFYYTNEFDITFEISSKPKV